MYGRYLIIEIEKGKEKVLFIVCPECGAYTQITGTKKPQKVRLCWKCDSVFTEGE